MSVTTNRLLQDIKTKALFPSTQNTVSDVTLLRWADEEQHLNIVPLIIDSHEDYMVHQDVISVVPSSRKYLIPARAVGNKISVVKIQIGADLFEATRVDRSDRDLYQDDNSWKYYIQGNQIIFTTDPKQAATMIIDYVRRPSTLVLESNSRKVISVTNNTIEINSLADWISIGSTLDVVSERYNEIVAMDVVVITSNAGQKTITLSGDLDRVEVGDWINIAGETSIVQLPLDTIQLLAERVSLRTLQAIGDQAGFAIGLNRVVELEKNVARLVTDRVVSDPRKVINREGFLRNSYARGR